MWSEAWLQAGTVLGCETWSVHVQGALTLTATSEH